MARKRSRTGRRSYTTSRRSYTTKSRARRGRPAQRAQTVRLVFQAAPMAPGPMVDPLGGTQLVMPGAPRPKRARF